jgi:hypothetical protein
MHISTDFAPLAAERSTQSRMSKDWYAENVRLTFFGVKDWTQRPIFSEITGAAPAQINALPPMQIHQEAGNFSDAYLSVAQQANRIDVVLSDQPTRNTVDPALPGYKPLYWIGPPNESIEIFDAIAEKTTSLVSGATRIAYAVTLVHQTDSVREAVLSLRKYLPTVEFDPDNDLDLAFQINRPIRDAKGRFINRLARWDTIQVASMRVGVGSVLSISPLPSRPPICAARIYVDISTDVDNTSPFPRPELSELLGELRAHAITIAENGDSK